MSWAVTGIRLNNGEVGELDEKRLLEFTEEDKYTDEVREQVASALEALLVLLSHNALGKPKENNYVVSISGHANPGHKPAPGWAKDCVTITVSQCAPSL